MDFWAGYISGAAGILIGNPLDIIKTRLQAGHNPSLLSADLSDRKHLATKSGLASRATYASLFRGAAAPIAGYGALNGILFFSYNRTLHLLNSAPTTSSSSSPTPDWKTFLAGAIGGLATFVVSAPTELVKCRAQTHIPLNPGAPQPNSWTITKQLWREGGRWGLPGLYIGGGVTSVRDAVGYGFYFWTYDTLTTTLHSPAESPLRAHLITLWCGGLAGCATWTSVFPLDVVKTRLQAQATQLSTISSIEESHGQPLQRPSAWAVGRVVWQQGGWAGFWRGLGVCNVRAFVVNAVQWSVYESAMRMLAS